jgi:ADP-heptose:LPS heptosyltransferase
MERGRLSGVKKIAILRALVLGDLIFALPALDALHNTYPEAEIVYLGRLWHEKFLAGRVPGIQRVIGFPPAAQSYQDLGFLIDPEAASQIFPRLQAEQFDLAIQMQGGGYNANPFIQRLGARTSLGTRERGALAPDRWLRYQYHQHEVIRLLDLVALVGARTENIHPHMRLLPDDAAAAAPFLQRIRRPFAVIHSGARDIRRCWPVEQFAQAADLIRQNLGLEIVLTGTSEVDDQKAQTIAQRMQGRATNLSGKLSLPALAGLLSQAEIMVSNDTGPFHMALALGTRAIGLFWVEYLIKSLPLRRDIFTPLVAWERICPLCGSFMTHYEVVSCDPRACMHETSFLTSIQPEEVLEAAVELLSKDVLPRQDPHKEH